jgi:predicted transcriptional regulator
MVNMFPTAAGHQLDLNHLWQQVQELSAVLAQNRESTAGLVRRADEIRVCHGSVVEDGGDLDTTC